MKVFFFAIKATPLGENLCLLEESKVRVIKDLIEEGETWWKQWFLEIRKWDEMELLARDLYDQLSLLRERGRLPRSQRGVLSPFIFQRMAKFLLSIWS